MSTKTWTGNALAIAQQETYAPGPQLPNTQITAEINGKTASYLSATGSNDDLIKGLIAAISAITQQAPEFAELNWQAFTVSPAVPAPNATYLAMTAKVPGTPFTVSITLTTPAYVTVTPLVAGQAGVNAVQQLTISPNAESGSTFTASWGGDTTGNVPTPPSAPSAALNGAGNLGSTAPGGDYFWKVTFGTALGETEPGLPSEALSLNNQQATVTIPTGASVVTYRRVYRTLQGATSAGPYYLVGTVNDNTSTTFADNVADATAATAAGPPLTNGALQGALEALASIGQGNIKVAGANTAAYVGMTMPSSPIIYTVEFRGDLGNAEQTLIGGNVASVTILPTVSIATSTAGCGPQNEIQQFGWEQVIGTSSPAGTAAFTLPGLNVTTAPVPYNASAATVQAALVAAAGPAYATAFNVSLVQSTNAGYLWQLQYQGPLALQPVPLITVDVSKITAAAGDTVTGYQARTQEGTSTGRNSAVVVTLNNSPSGGMFGLTATLANGNTISASGLAYNATAGTVQAAFPANTVEASGSAGGPYTLEAIGEAGGQAVTWGATSSLTGGGSPAGSPPGSNTTGLPVPGGVSWSLQGRQFDNNVTYYYKVTAVNAIGESLPSVEVTNAGHEAQSGTIFWNPVAGATSYKVYRGASAGGESVLLYDLPAPAGTANVAVVDDYQTHTSNSAPTPDGALDTNVQFTVYNNNGSGTLAAGTYYYVVEDKNGHSKEFTAVVAHDGDLPSFDTWVLASAGDMYTFWRGSSPGGENIKLGVMTMVAGTEVHWVDYGESLTSAAPPASDGTALSAPVQTAPTAATSGGGFATGTYYYKVTAVNANGETVASNEENIAVTGPTGEVTVNWNAVSGATGYRIYRGTSAGGENKLAAAITGGATTSYVDTGAVPASFTPTEITAGSAAVNAQQQIIVVGATGGSFALAYEGVGTVALPYNDTAADIQAKLQALSTVGNGGFTVSGADGGPFTITAGGALAASPLPLIASNSANLVGSVTSTASLTTVTASTGPNNWDNPQNWSPIGVPATGDTVVIQNNKQDILYGLDQSDVVLAGLQIDMSFVGGWIGLPGWNGKYYEYRQQYLQIGCSGSIVIGNGKGSGPTLIKLDTGTEAANFLINGTGQSTDPTLPVIQWKGNRAAGATNINIYKGSFGAALFAGETATVDTILQGYVTNVNSDSLVTMGPGVTIGTSWTMSGGQGTCYTSCPSLKIENGTLTAQDGLATTTLTAVSLIGGTLSDRTTGTITTLTVGSGSTYDRSDDSRPKTITNTSIYAATIFLDPNKSILFTNPYQLVNCGYQDLTKFDVGSNIIGQRTSL